MRVEILSSYEQQFQGHLWVISCVTHWRLITRLITADETDKTIKRQRYHRSLDYVAVAQLNIHCKRAVSRRAYDSINVGVNKVTCALCSDTAPACLPACARAVNCSAPTNGALCLTSVPSIGPPSPGRTRCSHGCVSAVRSTDQTATNSDPHRIDLSNLQGKIMLKLRLNFPNSFCAGAVPHLTGTLTTLPKFLIGWGWNKPLPTLYCMPPPSLHVQPLLPKTLGVVGVVGVFVAKIVGHFGGPKGAKFHREAPICSSS